MKSLLFSILTISVLLFLGWIIKGEDISYFLFQVGAPMKLYTCLYFIATSCAFLLKEINPKKYKFTITLLNKTVLWFCALVLSSQIFIYGCAGALVLSRYNSPFFDLPAIMTLINFISINYYLWLLINKPHKRRAWLMYFSCFTSSLSLIGFVTHNPILSYYFDNGRVIGMAFITSVFFFILSLMGIFRINQRKLLESLKRELTE